MGALGYVAQSQSPAPAAVMGSLVHTLPQGLPGHPHPRRGGGRALPGRGALAGGGGQVLSMAEVVSYTQLRQLEMQLEQEYEEKQMVLHEKQDLEGLIGTLCEQVRGGCLPRGRAGGAAGGRERAKPGLEALPVKRKKGSVNAHVCRRGDSLVVPARAAGCCVLRPLSLPNTTRRSGGACRGRHGVPGGFRDRGHRVGDSRSH